jgi:hypothetical protein
MRLVDVKRDHMTGTWVLRCAVCGPLGSFYKFWTASRTAEKHEEIH